MLEIIITIFNIKIKIMKIIFIMKSNQKNINRKIWTIISVIIDNKRNKAQNNKKYRKKLYYKENLKNNIQLKKIHKCNEKNHLLLYKITLQQKVLTKFKIVNRKSPKIILWIMKNLKIRKYLEIKIWSNFQIKTIKKIFLIKDFYILIKIKIQIL